MSKREITRVVPNEKNEALRDVYVDDHFFMTLPALLLAQECLGVGDLLDDAALEAMTTAAKLLPAKEKAYRCLEYGDLSRGRLIEKLTDAGFEAEIASLACDHLERQGFIDDQRLAARLTDRFAKGKRWGPRRMLPELLRRGIPMELAREAIEGLEFDYTESVRYYLETKYRRADLTDRRERSKVCQGLQRYGFDFEDINAVLSERTEE